MYIIIIGCGKVGLSLAEQLSDENHDITLVDSSADKLQNLSDDLDVMKRFWETEPASVPFRMRVLRERTF